MKAKPRRATEDDVLLHTRQYPEHGQARVAAELGHRGLAISASAVRQLWLRHGLQTTYQRLKAIETAKSTTGISAAQREIIRRGDQSRRAGKGKTSVGAESADRRTTILDAAARLFAARGYEGASVRELAQRVGLLPGSIYHYYRSKEDLFIAVHHEGFQQLIADVEQAIARVADPWQRIGAAFEAHIHAVVAGNTISTVTVASLFSLRDKRLNKRLKPDRDRYEKIFAALIDALPLGRQVDRKIFRFLAFGALNWTLVWYRAGGLEPRAIAAQFVTILRGARA